MAESGTENISPLPAHPEVTGKERFVIPVTRQTKDDLITSMGQLIHRRRGATEDEYGLGPIGNEDKRFAIKFFLPGERIDNAVATLTTIARDNEGTTGVTYTFREGDDGEIIILRNVLIPSGMNRPSRPDEENMIPYFQMEAERNDPNSYYYDDGLGPPSEGEIADIVADLKNKNLRRKTKFDSFKFHHSGG